MTAVRDIEATRLTFAVQLRNAMDDNNVSIRELARRLNPENPEAIRSGIHKWLRGKHLPSRTSRRTVAAALGLPIRHFIDDDPDSEVD